MLSYRVNVLRRKWPDKDQSGGETLVRCALHS